MRRHRENLSHGLLRGRAPGVAGDGSEEDRAVEGMRARSEYEQGRRYVLSEALRHRAHALIPGGAHTYAKGDDQYPVLAPGFITRGAGCHVWDVDGNEFVEYGMGLRAVTLGHAYPPVISAARAAMEAGLNFTRPSPVEVECAETFLSCVKSADMVKFAKNGSDATTAAVRLARAHTGRDLVAICADQPFFSSDDWFIGTTVMNAGVPTAERELTITFPYNDIVAVRALFDTYPTRIACVLLEAATALSPAPGFLEQLRALCSERGALLVFDEIITGFRWHLGGAQAFYGVTPDLSTFGKAMGNGFAVSALAGRRDIMERGGLRAADDRVFLLSTTHGAETASLAAAIAVLRVYRSEGVIETLARQGERLRRGVEEAAAAAGVADWFEVVGHPANLIYITRDRTGQRSQLFRSLFLQELIRGGVLAPSFVVSHSHRDEDIDRTVEVAAAALAVYRRAIDDGAEKYLIGRPVQPVFRLKA